MLADVVLVCWPWTAAAGGRRLAGLEFVEKLLTAKLTSTDTTERNAGMLIHPRPARCIGGRAVPAVARVIHLERMRRVEGRVVA
jgi:hypothetical protein